MEKIRYESPELKFELVDSDIITDSFIMTDSPLDESGEIPME